MNTSPSPVVVRQLVADQCRQLSGRDCSPDQVIETILVQGEQFVARSYRAGELFAMWLIDGGLLQFYDVDGNMLRTVNLHDDASSERRLAA